MLLFVETFERELEVVHVVSVAAVWALRAIAHRRLHPPLVQRLDPLP